jgi:TetR/AcrR family transcriptional regulator, cholesterol catabolism regulator
MEVKERIIEEASKQFLQYGIRAITMDGMARELGMSKRTIYELVGDKDKLLDECLDYFQKKKDEKHQLLIEQNHNSIEVFFIFLREGVEAMTTINPLFFLDIRKYHHAVWQRKIKQNESKNRDYLMSMLQKGMAEGLIREDINVDIVSKIQMEQIKILSNDEVFPTSTYSKAEVFENMMVNFARGISTLKGLQVIENLLENYKKSKQ